jgi:hypothetical protein
LENTFETQYDILVDISKFKFQEIYKFQEKVDNHIFVISNQFSAQSKYISVILRFGIDQIFSSKTNHGLALNSLVVFKIYGESTGEIDNVSTNLCKDTLFGIDDTTLAEILKLSIASQEYIICMSIVWVSAILNHILV